MASVQSAITHIQPEKHLIICDVDEVVLHFVAPFERYLEDNNAYLTKELFKLSGSIRCTKTHEPLSDELTRDHLQTFHEEWVDRQPLVEGAREALTRLAETFNIVFLTNIAEDLAQRRKDHLCDLELDFPLVQNDGLKTEAIAELSSHSSGQTIFIDDIPPHHIAAKERTPLLHCIHFMADQDFRKLAMLPPDIGRNTENWSEVEAACLQLQHAGPNEA